VPSAAVVFFSCFSIALRRIIKSKSSRICSTTEPSVCGPSAYVFVSNATRDVGTAFALTGIAFAFPVSTVVVFAALFRAPRFLPPAARAAGVVLVVSMMRCLVCGIM
jgi:hypothetical protein